jgi:hypothetical protein
MSTKWTTAILGVCLTLSCLVVVIAVVKGTNEGDFKNNLSFLPETFEGTHIENGYEANIIINPYLTGVCTAENGCKIDLAIGAPGVGRQFTENSYTLDLVPERSLPQVSDVAVTNITTPRSMVIQGATLFVNVTVTNYSFDYETFSLATYANTTAIDTQTVTLTAKGSTAITIPWNTLTYPVGNYTISSTASPSPGETSTYDNTYTFGTVQILQASTSGGNGCRIPYMS